TAVSMISGYDQGRSRMTSSYAGNSIRTRDGDWAASWSTPASRSAGKTTCPSRYRTLYAQNGMTCPLGRTWWMQHFISRRTSKLYASRNEVIVIRKTSDWASCSASARAKNAEAALAIGSADPASSPLALVEGAHRAPQPPTLARY